MDTRKNIYSLSDPALTAFLAAVKALKADGGYDDFVGRHFHGGHMIHRGPAFLPWHRYFIREFELALQARVPGVVLPYWDWAADAAGPTAAPLWNADPTQGRLYIGGDGDTTDGDLVKTGPFVNWTALIGQGNQLVPRQPPGLIRRLGRDLKFYHIRAAVVSKTTGCPLCNFGFVRISLMRDPPIMEHS